jgi:hypothetical protein
MPSSNEAALSTLGLMNECVMAVYGISRLLKSRDLGPSQLVPAVQAFRDEVCASGASMDPLFRALRSAAAGQSAVCDAVDVLEPTARAVAAEITKAFEGPLKLGARRRLEMERAADRLGADLEAVRGLAEVLLASLYAGPVYLTLFDLLHGRWYAPPNFVAQTLKVVLEPGDHPGFSVEPRVLRALLEQALHTVVESGVEVAYVSARSDGDSVVVEVGVPPEGVAPETAARQAVELGIGVSLPVVDVVLAAAAARQRIELSSPSPRHHVLRLPRE